MSSIVEKPYSEKKLSFDGYRVNDVMADGEGVIVYVMDSGYNPDPQRISDEGIFFPGKVEFPQQDGDVKPTQPKKTAKDLSENFNAPKFKVTGQPTGPKVRDVTARQHGPSITALIGASKAGVASRCRIAPLRCTIGVESAAAATPGQTKYDQAMEDGPDIQACIESCRTILDYHKKKHAGKPAIINCSFTFTYRSVFEKLKYYGLPDDLLEDKTVLLIFNFKAAVEDLMNAGMILVASAGNKQQTMNAPWAEWKDGKQLNLDSTFRAPQCFDNVIVVGGLNRDGKLWEHSGTGKLVSHYLLADDVENPCHYYFYDDEWNDKNRLMKGTSIATAFLSGIIACVLSSPQYAARAQTGGDDVQGRIRQILEEVSDDFDDGKGNKCRAFMTGTIDLKKVV